VTASPRSPGRSGHAWRQLVAHVREQVEIHGLCCVWCHRPINLELLWPDPMSFSVDHVVALVAGGDPLEPSNAGPMHLGCNASKGSRPLSARPEDLRPDRDW
jgi:hypothetical protein